MIIEITLDGNTYQSKEVEVTSDEFSQSAEAMFKNISEITKFKMEMDDGKIMIIGKEAIQRAVIIIKP